ncbi:hypothetical protein BJX66DRAFT_147432 [Aspergillus keveii]|uniref:Uncharacterized protein n=1 Tax=Aspergillus keveii TaxID=714993 RepID=A0ABR4FI59_9EURO
MPPKRTKKDDKPPAPSAWSPNPFSLLDSAPQRLTETPTRPSSPRVSTRPSTPQELHDIVLEIPLELATVQSRLQTFHQWPLAHITPRQLARLGFWHAPSDKDRDSVSCFACDVSVQRWRDVEHTTAELLALHDDHCVWADLLEDMETFPNLSSYEPTGQLPRTSTIETKTEPLSSSSSIQPRHPTTESQEPPQAQEPLQPQVPSTPTPSSRKSYASVLKTPLNPPTRLKAKLTSASQSPGPATREKLQQLQHAVTRLPSARLEAPFRVLLSLLMTYTATFTTSLRYLHQPTLTIPTLPYHNTSWFQQQRTRYQTFCSRPFRPLQDTYRTCRLEDLTVALPIHGKSRDESEGILIQSLARDSGPHQGGLTQAKQTVPDDTEKKTISNVIPAIL